MKSRRAGEKASSIGFRLDGSVVVERTPWQATAAMAVLSALFASAFIMATYSMLELNPLPGAFVAACIAVAAELVLVRNAKLFKYGNIGLLAAAAILAIWRPGKLADGFAIIRNVLCEKSMEHQSYHYDMLAIGAAQPDYMSCIAVGMVFIGAIVGCIIAASLLKRHPAAAIALVAVFFCLQMYFGIAPGQMLDVILLALLALAIVLCATRRKGISIVEQGRASALIASVALTALVLVVVGVAVYNIYPAEYRYNNPAVRQASEQIRDATAVYRQASPDNDMWTNTEDETDVKQDNTDYEQESYWHEDSNADQKASLDIPWPLFLIPAALLALIVLAIIYFAKRHGVRKRMRSVDAHVSIEAWFRYLMRWLMLSGVERKNIGYSGYAPQVESLFGPEAREDYLGAVALWQEATYSTHECGSSDADEMSGLAKKLIATVGHAIKPSQRAKARFLCYWGQ